MKRGLKDFLVMFAGGIVGGVITMSVNGQFSWKEAGIAALIIAAVILLLMLLLKILAFFAGKHR